MLLHRRSLIAVYLAFGALAAFTRCYQCTVLAVWREYAMEAGQVSSRPGYQGCKACHEIQWLEDNVGSAISIRCLQLVADVAARCRRQAPMAGVRIDNLGIHASSDHPPVSAELEHTSTILLRHSSTSPSFQVSKQGRRVGPYGRSFQEENDIRDTGVLFDSCHWFGRLGLKLKIPCLTS